MAGRGKTAFRKPYRRTCRGLKDQAVTSTTWYTLQRQDPHHRKSMANTEPHERLLRSLGGVAPQVHRQYQPDQSQAADLSSYASTSSSFTTRQSLNEQVPIPIKRRTTRPSCLPDTEEVPEVQHPQEQDLGDEYARSESPLGLEPRSLGEYASRDTELDVAPGYTAGRVEYEPIDVPPGYTPLNFRPALLSSPATMILMVLYVGIIGGMFALLYCSGSKLTYEVENVNYYFVAHYGPSMV